jgi:hypothetical protein
MTPSAKQLTDPRILLLYLLCLSLLAAVFLVCGEVIARYKGAKPFRVEDGTLPVEPGGRLSVPHPTLGHAGLPGSFVATLPTGYKFRATHLPDGNRITHPLESYDAASQKPEIWIFGCSNTYGWSLSDEETFPWLLQERFPEYEIVNFGRKAYGTVHSAMQFREALTDKTPKVVILAYAGFHDLRNTLSRVRRKSMTPYHKLDAPPVHPIARLENGVLRYSVEKFEYLEFPLMRQSALSHYLENAYNGREIHRHQNRAVTLAIIADIADLARKHEAAFMIAGIVGAQETLDWAKDNGIPGVDISVDLTIKENNNLPHDAHPSAVANKKYADKLEAFLRENMLRQATPIESGEGERL